jgi:hypothetical protein
VKPVRNWGVFAYLVAVLIAIALLFAITAVPGNSAELFPNPSSEELAQVVQWVWEASQP